MARQEESLIKRAIGDYLATMPNVVMFWYNSTTGRFDPRSKKFFPLNGKYDRKGISDILGLFSDGVFLAIEVKSKKGRLTPDQKSFLEDVKKHGGVAIVARSVEDVVSAFRRGGADLD